MFANHHSVIHDKIFLDLHVIYIGFKSNCLLGLCVECPPLGFFYLTYIGCKVFLCFDFQQSGRTQSTVSIIWLANFYGSIVFIKFNEFIHPFIKLNFSNNFVKGMQNCSNFALIDLYESLQGLNFILPKKRISPPTFMKRGELKFLWWIKKNFRYFTIFNFIININKICML